MSSFSKKAAQGNKDSQQEGNTTDVKEFKRDESDNKLFKAIQVDNIEELIHKDTVFYYDYDTPVYKICSNLETKQIKVTLKSDPTVTEVLKNITTFKGRGKNIAESSWLGLANVDRELLGEPLWTVGDFTIEEFQTLKLGCEEKAFEQAKIELYKGLKKVRQQYNINHIKLVIGSGDNFRHKLDLCRPYKGNRQDTLRPLLLSRVRKWVVEELQAIAVQPRPDGEMIEADDVVEFYGSKGIASYLKTGKFDFGVIASDKDSLNSGKLLINADLHVGEHNPLRGKFKFPQPMLIQATNKCVGDLELVVKGNKTTTKEVKGYGFLFLLYQALLGQDQADNYNAISHLDKGLDFGDLSAYKVLKPCKTPKEALEACLKVYSDFFPKGVEYTTFDGRELHVDTMTYMNTYFRVAYMTRSEVDTMDLYKLCDAFKVDYSHLVGNNVEKLLPFKEDENLREEVKNTTTQIEDIISILEDKSGKVADKNERKQIAIDMLTDMKGLSNMFQQ